VNYYFIYGTDPNNLNQSTTTQQITIPANQDASVSAAISGLTSGKRYYCKLVVNTTQSSRKEIFVLTLPAANLKMWLRVDLDVSSSLLLVSNWGDVSG
jgi:type IV pilus biogenesis protein CpaD/CtpE